MKHVNNTFMQAVVLLFCLFHTSLSLSQNGDYGKNILVTNAEQGQGLKQYSLDATLSSVHQLVVNNGYGAGSFNAGDTVHIWAETPNQTKTFFSWSGDVGILEEKGNWHTTLIMPNKDITLNANYISLPNNLQYKGEKIQGPSSTKEIFSYFPPKDKIKGVAWFFSGASGFGRYWVIRPEENELLDLLAANDFAIITMDSEEASQNVDMNGDGVEQYSYDLDTINNLDLVNLKFFKNYFIQHDKFYENAKHLTVGFSSGGGFAEIAAAVYNWTCSISHNTNVAENIAVRSNVPHYQNNSFHDHGTEPGVERNQVAAENIKKYQDRGIKAKYILQYPQPLHKERFARVDAINLTQSATIFNFLKQNGYLDQNDYLIGDPEPIQKDYENHPDKYPALQALGPEIVREIFEQLKVIYTDHIFRSDYNGSALRFITESLDIALATKNQPKKDEFNISPNPATSKIYLQGEFDNWTIFTQLGNPVLSGNSKEINIENFVPGIYFLKSNQAVLKFIRM